MEEKLIAPCGMNCEVCISYLAMKNDLNKRGFKRVYCEEESKRGSGLEMTHFFQQQASIDGKCNKNKRAVLCL